MQLQGGTVSRVEIKYIENVNGKTSAVLHAYDNKEHLLLNLSSTKFQNPSVVFGYTILPEVTPHDLFSLFQGEPDALTNIVVDDYETTMGYYPSLRTFILVHQGHVRMVLFPERFTRILQMFQECLPMTEEQELPF